MYVWVLLATFMAMLYGFNLSTRDDMETIYVVPQAESVVSKIVAQHKAAQKYIRDHQPPDNGNSVVSFFPGKISMDTLQYYLPYGFKRTEEYTSWVYCLDRTSANLSASIPCAGGGPSCCSDSKSLPYLVTYGCIPLKWRNLITGKPSNNLLKAIETVVGIGNNFGYADAKDETRWGTYETVKSTMAIRGRELTYTSIPQYIISDNAGGTDANPSFNRLCVNNGTKKCPYCLIYMSVYD